MQLNADTFMHALDWLYEKAVDGIPGSGTVEELAASYLEDNTLPLSTKIDALIRWQIAKASTSGFLAGLGGILTLPIAIPANLSTVLYVQLRMVAAIAHMSGHDVRNDQVKTLCYVRLCGNAAKDVLKRSGIVISQKIAMQAIDKVPGAVLLKINQTVGFRLVTKFGSKGVINLVEAVPLVGGVVGGTLDGVATRTIGKVAKRTFLRHDNVEPDLPPDQV